MLNEPVFLTDANHDVILEVICGSPNVALPDCCKPFDRMIPGTTDGASEKHVPIIETSGLHVTVKVGEILHPMSQEHNIAWVCLQTKAGSLYRACLTKDSDPVVHFTLEEGDFPAAAYAFCNLHGFWKSV
ncbi:desulfoferrodoxin family protein [Lachnoclostridium edouardi]|uniref:desulfoferrodoxin family protein n=1 Tax=Lachnoclostridium edouardi TaxID=1926283 RepID=UPI000C7A1BCF|nr:desulfoferrodoxin family protein [Lachnoclostridium edouardi]